jgi:hypothetical protein
VADPTPPPTTHFVVSRLNWRVDWNRGFVRAAGDARVSAFADFATAETDRAAREAAAREVVNPFRCGGTWGERSHMPEPVFRDFIADAGIEPPTLVPVPTTHPDGRPVTPPERRKLEREAPPPGTFRDWTAWWDAVAPALSAEQRGRVWEGLDRVRFFRVEERPVRQIGFVVLQIEWNYNDEWYFPPSEGGGAYHAYRTRERAEVECAKLNAEAREQWRQRLRLPAAGEPMGWEAYAFDMFPRVFPGDDPLAPRRQPPKRALPGVQGGKFSVDEVPFYEVVEFELPEEA